MGSVNHTQSNDLTGVDIYCRELPHGY